MNELSSILVGLFSALSVIIVAFFKWKEAILNYKKAIQEKDDLIRSHEVEKRNIEVKLEFFNRIHSVKFFNDINNAVDKIFKYTSADRFLILIAINGKTDFNIVTSIFERRKDNDKKHVRPRYENIPIDEPYKNMLKEAERKELIKLTTQSMEQSKLKSFYEYEKVNFSHVRFLSRKPIDDDNDFIVFSSLATHGASDFTTMEIVLSQLQFDSIIKPSINEILTLNQT